MLRRLIGLGFVGIFVLAPGAARADWTEISSDDFLVSPPPEAGSKADDKDYAELHRWQEERTKADCDEGYAQVNHSFSNLFGDELTESELEQVEPLMKRVFKKTTEIGSFYKNEWDRPRPYTADKTIKPCVPRPGTGRSYPSSHAAMGTVGGCVLAKAFPKKAAALRKHGKRIGDLRVIVGVHHPTDVKTGQKLGQDICDRLMQYEDFVAELP